MQSVHDELWQAVGNRDLPTVRSLLNARCDANSVCPDAQARDGVGGKRGLAKSLLHHAAWAGNLDVFRSLIEARATVDVGRAVVRFGASKVRGTTCLHHAATHGRGEIMLYLLDAHGADIDAQSEDGLTPLHLAVKFNHPRVVESLLKRGANTDLVTCDDSSVRDFAKAQRGRSHLHTSDMLQLFEKYDSASNRRSPASPTTVRPQRTQQRRRRAPAMPDVAVDPSDDEESVFLRKLPEESVFSLLSPGGSSIPSEAVGSSEAPPASSAASASSPQRLRRVRIASPKAKLSPEEAEMQRLRLSELLHRGSVGEQGKQSEVPRNRHGCRPPTSDALDTEMRRRSAEPSSSPVSPPVSTSPLAARGAYHDPTSTSQNTGNHLGSRSCVRQSKLFRMYESGNAAKEILGQESLQWSVDRKEGVFAGHQVFDSVGGAAVGGRSSGDGREVSAPDRRGHAGRQLGGSQSAGSLVPASVHGDGAGDRWSTSSACYGHSSPPPRRRDQRRAGLAQIR